MKIKGLDAITKDLKKLEKNINQVSGENSVQFSEMFTYEFMHENTNIDSIDDFFRCAGLEVETQEDFKNLNEKILDEAVVKFTSFSSWKEMFNEAGKEYVEKRIFEGIKVVKK